MTATPSAALVPGEDTPSGVAGALGGAGALAFLAAAVLGLASAAPPPAPAPEPRPAPAPPAASALSATLPPLAAAVQRRVCPPLVVGFDLASVRVSNEDGVALDALARWLESHGEASLLVHGHADAFGKDDANLHLSRLRAHAVAGRLAERGVARARMTVRGFGSYQPVEGAAEEAASNRRVVVYVRAGDPCPWSTREEAP